MVDVKIGGEVRAYIAKIHAKKEGEINPPLCDRVLVRLIHIN